MADFNKANGRISASTLGAAGDNGKITKVVALMARRSSTPPYQKPGTTRFFVSVGAARVQPMNQTFINLLLLAGALQSCAADQPDTENSPANSNKMSCMVEGKTLVATGEQVGMGSFGLVADSLSLGLTMTTTQGNQQFAVGSGLLKVPLRTGSYYFPALNSEGYSGGSYEEKDAQGDLVRGYSDSNYLMFFARQANDPNTKLRIDLRRAEKKAASQPGFATVHLVGSFSFKAAYVPMDNGALPEPCTAEAVKHSLEAIHGGALFPKYNATICGAKETTVTASFDVTEDVPVVR